MTDLRKAAQQATPRVDLLAELMDSNEPKTEREHAAVYEIERLRAAMAQAGAEPVATKLDTQQFNCFHVSAEDFERLRALPVGTKLYTHPPARVPLTEDEIDKLPWGPHEGNPLTFAEGLRDFARAVIAAYEAKNGIGGGK